MQSAQDIIDEVYNTDKYDIEPNVSSSYDSEKDLVEVSLELENAIYQELTVPFEKRDILWAQTIIDTV